MVAMLRVALRPRFLGLLALMTGIEVFANLVAAYDGAPEVRARKAFGSLVIVMVTTLVTMMVVGARSPEQIRDLAGLVSASA